MKDLSGKPISTLVKEGLKLAQWGTTESLEQDEDLKTTDAYKKLFGDMTSTILKGSPKQIKWAEEIRAKKAGVVALMLVKTLISVLRKESDIDFNKYANYHINSIRNINSAKWFIENK